MDETLSTDERSTLRAGAIGALRAMLAAQEARLPLRPRFYRYFVERVHDGLSGTIRCLEVSPSGSLKARHHAA